LGDGHRDLDYEFILLTADGFIQTKGNDRRSGTFPNFLIMPEIRAMHVIT